MSRKLRSAGGGLVYSSDKGEICPGCDEPITKCRCGDAPLATSENPTKAVPVRVGRETKGRKGGVVTVVNGLPLDAEALAALAGQLKRRCGSGGTVKDGIIEIQGDHRQAICDALALAGWKPKLAGG